MSHLVKMEIEIKDLDAMEVAAKECGIQFRRGQSNYRWYNGQKSQCTHALHLDGKAYEVGIIEKPGGGYTLAFDPFMGGYGMMAKIGPKAGLLKQAYAVEVARKQLVKKGYRVSVSTKDGKKILLATK